MKKVTLMLFLLLFNKIHSQENYKVIFDYNSGKVTYLHLDGNKKTLDTLVNPKFKRNSLIEVQLKNVNPFALDVVADLKEEEIHQSGGNGFNFSSLLGGMSGVSGNKLKLNVENLPTNSNLFSSGTTSRGEASANTFSSLNELITKVDAMKKTLSSDLINPNMDKQTILNNVKKIAATIEDVRLPDPNDNIYLYLSTIEGIIQTDKQKIVSTINEMNSEIEKKSQSDKQLSRGELGEQNDAYKDLQNLLITLNASTAQTSENLEKTEALYTSLQASSFEKTYDYELTSDKADLELKFVQSGFSKASGVESNQNVMKIKHIKMFSKGGFKINTSIAMTLNNFGNKSRDYFIDENGIVGADVNNFYTPNLSTLINFYPIINENFNIGGSFGLSIPISDNVKGINFLIGPSLFFGNKSRVSLSGGVAYGPVNKLTHGLKEGDTTQLNDIGNYTKSVYEFGIYFGISFSLFDIK